MILIKKYIFEVLFFLLSILLLSPATIYFNTLLLCFLFSITMIFKKFNLDFTWLFIFILLMAIVLFILKPFILVGLMFLYIILFAFNQFLFFAGPSVVLFLLSFILVRHFNINLLKKLIFTFFISIVLGLNFKIPFVINSLVSKKAQPIINKQLNINKKTFVNLVSNVEEINYGFSPFPCMCNSYSFPWPYPRNFGSIATYKQNINDILKANQLITSTKAEGIKIYIDVENIGNFTKISYKIKKEEEVLASYQEKFISKFLFDKRVYTRFNTNNSFKLFSRIRLVIANNIWMKLANAALPPRYETFRTFMQKAIKRNYPKKVIKKDYRLEQELGAQRIKEQKDQQRRENEKIKKLFQEKHYELNHMKII